MFFLLYKCEKKQIQIINNDKDEKVISDAFKTKLNNLHKYCK